VSSRVAFREVIPKPVVMAHSAFTTLPAASAGVVKAEL
jgi:hypothetical protein